jgi:hypothetical protein
LRATSARNGARADVATKRPSVAVAAAALILRS